MINLEQLSNYITINDNTQTLLNVAMARIKMSWLLVRDFVMVLVSIRSEMVSLERKLLS